jgi:hypothetical protein
LTVPCSTTASYNEDAGPAREPTLVYTTGGKLASMTGRTQLAGDDVAQL